MELSKAIEETKDVTECFNTFIHVFKDIYTHYT